MPKEKTILPGMVKDLEAATRRSPPARHFDVRASVRFQWPLREALIRLLWRAVADGDGCVCEPGDPTDICEAMSALGWGAHWNTETFQRMAMSATPTTPRKAQPPPPASQE